MTDELILLFVANMIHFNVYICSHQTPFPDLQWHHVAVVKDGNDLQIYHDGNASCQVRHRFQAL